MKMKEEGSRRKSRMMEDQRSDLQMRTVPSPEPETRRLSERRLRLVTKSLWPRQKLWMV